MGSIMSCQTPLQQEEYVIRYGKEICLMYRVNEGHMTNKNHQKAVKAT